MIDTGVCLEGFLPGEVLGEKYRIERVLGRGGMGVVLLARNLLLRERVAIKVLARQPTPTLTARLVMEARAAARLRSDHVVRVFDVANTKSGDPYIVMEYLEGRSLAELLQHSSQPALRSVLGWVLQACEGIASAHRHGIVHRDLKPANLFVEQRLDGSFRIKVLDFGIAKLPDAEATATTTHPVGSPMYMAPEQLSNAREVDARTDVWGIGSVLYECLTGRPPFSAHCLLELAGKLSGEAHVPAHLLRPELPKPLSAVVDRCLAKRREQRWQSVAELAAALRPFTPPECLQLIEYIERLGAGPQQGDALVASELDIGGGAGTPGESSAKRWQSTPPLSTSVTPSAAPARRALPEGRWLLFIVISAAALSLATGLVSLPSSGVQQERLEPPNSAPAQPDPTITPMAPHREQPASGGTPALPTASTTRAEPRASVTPSSPRAKGPQASRARAAAHRTAHSPARKPRPSARASPPGPAGPLPIDRELSW
jgi:eukaryotic-like serine/threonine-protein kinase